MWLLSKYSGTAQVRVTTTQGYRHLDLFSGGTAYESKVGYLKFSQAAVKQIKKDIEILQTVKKGVVNYEWHFFRSSITGKIGADVRLIQLLESGGIRIVIH